MSETLIAAGGFARQGRTGVVLGPAERPLVVKGPDEGHRQPTDFLNGKRSVAKPMQMGKLKQSLFKALLKFSAKTGRRPGNRNYYGICCNRALGRTKATTIFSIETVSDAKASWRTASNHRCVIRQFADHTHL
jgi:hypothetical protein